MTLDIRMRSAIRQEFQTICFRNEDHLPVTKGDGSYLNRVT